MNDPNEFLILKKFYKEMKNTDNCETASNYISNALENMSTCFDTNVIEQYKENPDFMELCILHNILQLIGSETQIKYVSRCFRNFRISAGKDYITEDEIFTFSIMSFIYSILAITNAPNNPNVFENGFKNIITILDLQGRRLKLGYSKKMVFVILNMPDNVIHMAGDIYYSIWTFQVAHEIHHILCDEDNPMSQEIAADKFGYSTLIEMIKRQKKGELPTECCCFYEYTYLTPIILFEYLKLVDLWKELCGIKINTDEIHPSNERRANCIFSWFDELVPDDFDTREGNEIINHCLEAIDSVTENIKLKVAAGKLDSIILKST